jgi:rhodanese-related sulfurtransferase
MSGFKIIDTDDLDRRLSKGGIVNFWNVLSDDYFTGELIPGSRHVPVDRVGREARALGLDPDAEIVVYCSGPTCPNSSTAARKLAGLGYRSVREYADGLSAWKEAGHTVVEVPATATVS